MDKLFEEMIQKKKNFKNMFDDLIHILKDKKNYDKRCI